MLTKTNNYSSNEMLISIKTGAEKTNIALVGAVLIVLVSGIILVRKVVLQ